MEKGVKALGRSPCPGAVRTGADWSGLERTGADRVTHPSMATSFSLSSFTASAQKAASFSCMRLITERSAPMLPCARACARLSPWFVRGAAAAAAAAGCLRRLRAAGHSRRWRVDSLP